MKRLALTNEQIIQQYNNNIYNEDEQIYYMNELPDFLSYYDDDFDENQFYENPSYIYDEYEKDLIRKNQFNLSDDYFWLGSDGYLYSGSSSEAIAANVNKNTDDIINTDTYTRFEVNGEGFVRFSDELNNKKISDLINKLMSNMTTPTQKQIEQATKENKKCFFTDKGLAKYSQLIDLYIDKLSDLNIAVDKVTKTTTDIIPIDDYQVFA